MNRLLLPVVLLASFVSTGCATTQAKPAPDTVTAYVPVVQFKSAPEYEYPKLLYLEQITEDTSESDVLKFYYLTIEQLKGEVIKLSTLLSGYRCDNPNKDGMCIAERESK